MSRQNRDRHVWGETNPIYVKTPVSNLIMTGDMVYMGSSYYLYSSNYPATEAGAPGTNARFVGVAMQYAVNADPDHARVATEGVFEFDTDDTFTIGQGVYQARNPQFVYGTADKATAVGIIGRAWKRYPTTTTKVLVKIDTSAFFTHAAQA